VSLNALSMPLEAVAPSAVSQLTRSLAEGSILMERGAHLPASLVLRSSSFSSDWAEVDNVRATLDKQLHDEGWIFYFLAGKIETTVFGSNQEKILNVALKRLAKIAVAQKCNSFEIAQIAHGSFFGLPRVTVSAHARHLQQGVVLLRNETANK
jgi:hypothetical protein